MWLGEEKPNRAPEMQGFSPEATIKNDEAGASVSQFWSKEDELMPYKFECLARDSELLAPVSASDDFQRAQSSVALVVKPFIAESLR